MCPSDHPYVSPPRGGCNPDAATDLHKRGFGGIRVWRRWGAPIAQRCDFEARLSCVILFSRLTTKRSHLVPLSAALALAALTTVAGAARDGTAVLVYHRFGPAVNDSMTVRTTTFRSQLAYLKEHHHPVIPLRTLISYLQGRSPAPPAGAVVVTADDGHRSVFTEMLPVVREYGVPVTLFIYPSAISNASYAMTWDQLDTLRKTGLFDIESHTYWHPNFKIEKRRLSPSAFQTFATMQLVKPRATLERKAGIKPDLLAWPFGISDEQLIEMARAAGYVAAFTLDRRLVTAREPLLALPRFLMTESTAAQFRSILPDEPR
jgi:Polysaccharide deacetylase